jgi:hypothetical protein
MTRRKTKKGPAELPVSRPVFVPCWSDADAKRIACDRWAPNSAWIAGCRLAIAVLAKTPDDLIRGALMPSDDEGAGPAETVSNVLREAQEELESQLEVVRAAQARVLMSACYALGVEPPVKG